MFSPQKTRNYGMGWNATVVITLQYTHVSHQDVAHVKLTQCCQSVMSLCSEVLSVASVWCWEIWGGREETRLRAGLDAVRNSVGEAKEGT